MSRGTGLVAFGAEGEGATVFEIDFALKDLSFPFLEIAHHTYPTDTLGTAEVLLIIVRRMWFKKKHFNERTCSLCKMQTGLDDAGVVHHHQRTLREQRGEVVEMFVGHLLSRAVDKEFGVVAFGKRIASNTLIGERIVIVGYLYMTGVSEHFSFSLWQAGDM